MSLWADYIKELRGPEFRQWLEYPDGFVAYSLPAGNDCIIIHDMYVKPELRESGRGSALLIDVCEVGRRAGRKYVVAEVELATLTATTALKAQLAVGFSPVVVGNGNIFLQKEILNG